jgi:hypothetical protein
MANDARTGFFTDMFRVQFSYLHHRLRREGWWGMDYGLGNLTMLKVICGFAGGPKMDLGEIQWRQTLAECWKALGVQGGRTDRDNAPGLQDGPDQRRRFADFTWDLFGRRWLAAYPVFERDNADRAWFGCFRYDCLADANDINLHFMNADEPKSPFEDMNRRKEDLRRIVAAVRAKGLSPARMHFVSWMNNLKPILELFPPSHAASLTPTEEFPKGYGWWGQLITRDGRINPRRAELIKRAGRFEYVRLAGNCPWTEFSRKWG